MSKTIKNSFDDKLTFNNILEVHKRASFSRSDKLEILKFNTNLECNIVNIINELHYNKYKPSKYKTFTIYEPKGRIIKSLPYKDRVIQQWYIYEFIKPYIISRLINSTCACIDKRGTYALCSRVSSEIYE